MELNNTVRWRSGEEIKNKAVDHGRVGPVADASVDGERFLHAVGEDLGLAFRDVYSAVRSYQRMASPLLAGQCIEAEKERQV